MKRPSSIATRTRSLLAVAVPLLALGTVLACPPADEDDDDDDRDAGVEVLDSGTNVDGGGGGGEGEGEGDPLPLCDGGLCPDSGVTGQEYSGTEETGVVCETDNAGDNDLCTGGSANCCLALAGGSLATSCTADGACNTGFAGFVAPCDGPEDCQVTEECCLAFAGLAGNTTCVPIGQCGAGGATDSVVCVNTADCDANELCCTFAGIDLPIDIGTCAPAANNCAVQ